jgi:hypothetical protein
MAHDWNLGDTRLMREVLREKLGRDPLPATALFAAVADEVGTVCSRRLWRALRWLEGRGEALRIGRKWAPLGYVRGSTVISGRRP